MNKQDAGPVWRPLTPLAIAEYIVSITNKFDLHPTSDTPYSAISMLRSEDTAV